MQDSKVSVVTALQLNNEFRVIILALIWTKVSRSKRNNLSTISGLCKLNKILTFYSNDAKA
jgi:hypothetical protein